MSFTSVAGVAVGSSSATEITSEDLSVVSQTESTSTEAVSQISDGQAQATTVIASASDQNFEHNGYACASIFSNVLKSVYFTTSASNDPIPSGVSFTTVDPSGGAGTIIADVIQVQWQDKDQKIISLMSERTATGAAKTGATQTAPTPAATLTPQAAADSGGISTGAKVGIGVAVPIIVLALLAIAAIFFLRMRKRRAAKREEPPIEAEAKNLHELSPQDQKPDEKKWDQQQVDRLAAQPPQEMEAQEYNELPADGPKHELGGQPMQRSSPYKNTYHAQSPSRS
ncbi:MAG: hypothetical protein Q9195_006967 [Heterodermia aff. obscurata]